MPQHFLLSAAARTLKLRDVFRMSDDEAHQAFTAIRFSENGGEPFCPACGCCDPYTIPTRRKWKCRACGGQFSATSGTIFASRKMAFVDLLAAISIFVNCAKGILERLGAASPGIVERQSYRRLLGIVRRASS
jgi:transposase-like protein